MKYLCDLVINTWFGSKSVGMSLALNAKSVSLPPLSPPIHNSCVLVTFIAPLAIATFSWLEMASLQLSNPGILLLFQMWKPGLPPNHSLREDGRLLFPEPLSAASQPGLTFLIISGFWRSSRMFKVSRFCNLLSYGDLRIFLSSLNPNHSHAWLLNGLPSLFSPSLENVPINQDFEARCYFVWIHTTKTWGFHYNGPSWECIHSASQVCLCCSGI